MGVFNFVFAILVGRIGRKWRKQKRLQRGVEADLLGRKITPVAHDHGVD